LAWIGKAIFLIGVVHSTFGVVVHRSTFAVLWSEGLIATVDGQPEREFMFWFMAFGLLAMIFGAFVNWCERRRLPLPGFLGWTLLAFTTVIVAIMPVSGGWLVFIPAMGAILRARSERSDRRNAA
jgi:hypothetical protein